MAYLRRPNRTHSNPKNLTKLKRKVFDSHGPNGKVRGMAHQVISKYERFAADAKSQDLAKMHSLYQHADHYLKMLNDIEAEEVALEEKDQNNHPSNSRSDIAKRSKDHKGQSTKKRKPAQPKKPAPDQLPAFIRTG